VGSLLRECALRAPGAPELTGRAGGKSIRSAPCARPAPLSYGDGGALMEVY